MQVRLPQGEYLIRLPLCWRDGDALNNSSRTYPRCPRVDPYPLPNSTYYASGEN